MSISSCVCGLSALGDVLLLGPCFGTARAEAVYPGSPAQPERGALGSSQLCGCAVRLAAASAPSRAGMRLPRKIGLVCVWALGLWNTEAVLAAADAALTRVLLLVAALSLPLIFPCLPSS